MGRPRLRPIADVPRADILAFPSARPTLEQKLADYDEAIDACLRGILDASRALTTLCRRYPKG
ncbi:hypothetical protein C0Z17_00930 [Trinickia caryophylli]|nr:hypothetical protein C0Z17_00930 [Trinickia caryophylli]